MCALVTTTPIAESSSMPSVDVEEEELTTDVTRRLSDERPAGLGAKQEHCCKKGWIEDGIVRKT